MKRFSPGASVQSDYYYICDCCEVDDGRSVLVWDMLPDFSTPRRPGHFALCLNCLTKLDQDYAHADISFGSSTFIVVNRIAIPESLRNQVYERDGYKCVKCGSTNNLQLDHIIPFSKGGKTEFDNLETLCKPCNLKKGTKHG